MHQSKSRMTIREVVNDLRLRGCPTSDKQVSELIKNGTFPFGTVLNIGQTGRTSFLILRKQYESWADENIGGKINEER